MEYVIGIVICLAIIFCIAMLKVGNRPYPFDDDDYKGENL